ncbi:MAG: tRNA 2-thiocytidine(32) synthetase TtcA [Ruminococcaceae bacterium]|nr:tRNA 2-thiocytidine(32) synthetase TtcA [Oscillospiraceae bacterium]
MDVRRVLSYVRRACEDYDMIKEGDRIAVGVSAGKDSLTLLCALAEMRRFYPKHYEVVAITIDMGFKDMDFSGVARLCEELDVPYHIVKTDIATVIFDIRKEKSPCALCAKMRRGALHNAARELGCEVVALGHHFDDVVDTFMLNLFYEGRIGCFQPVTDLSRVGVRVIRPMLYLPEKQVRTFAAKEQLPIVRSSCPADGNTQRTEMNKLINDLEKQSNGLRYRIFGALQRADVDGFAPLPPRPKVSRKKEE